MPAEVVDPERYPAERRRLIELADRALRENMAQLSGHHVQPKLFWTLMPKSEAQIRRLIEADGSSPFAVLAVMQLDRKALRLPGTPSFAQCAYLVIVEVKATFAE